MPMIITFVFIVLSYNRFRPFSPTPSTFWTRWAYLANPAPSLLILHLRVGITICQSASYNRKIREKVWRQVLCMKNVMEAKAKWMSVKQNDVCQAQVTYWWNLRSFITVYATNCLTKNAAALMVDSSKITNILAKDMRKNSDPSIAEPQKHENCRQKKIWKSKTSFGILGSLLERVVT